MKAFNCLKSVNVFFSGMGGGGEGIKFTMFVTHILGTIIYLYGTGNTLRTLRLRKRSTKCSKLNKN